jgi:hypothetical protein
MTWTKGAPKRAATGARLAYNPSHSSACMENGISRIAMQQMRLRLEVPNGAFASGGLEEVMPRSKVALDYSNRSASTGSTLAARRAGNQHATNATAASNTGMITNVSASASVSAHY